MEESLAQKIAARTATVGVIGLGYVGLPLASAAATAGFRTLGFDNDPGKLDRLAAGCSHIGAVAPEALAAHVRCGRLRPCGNFATLAECDVIIICVPTPLSRHREPDLSHVVATAETIARYLRPDQLVVVESTTYPGTTEEVVRPVLERGGLRSGRDFFLAFSPEREDPGNPAFRTAAIPKVVGGDGAQAAALAESFYGAVVEQVVRVASPRVAEAVKITENVFRAVNIALVNELKMIYGAMDIDVWQVIEAAATKPFGYMPFHPGPGVGGHCIPVDPFYLAWKAREYGMTTRFIELAGEVNGSMPRHVISKLEAELDRRFGMSLGSARVLVIGITYKKNVPDLRESPAFALMDLLELRGTDVAWFDPHVPEMPPTRGQKRYPGQRSVRLTAAEIARHDAVLIATDHDDVDYRLIAAHARLIVDTRNAFGARKIASASVIRA